MINYCTTNLKKDNAKIIDIYKIMWYLVQLYYAKYECLFLHWLLKAINQNYILSRKILILQNSCKTKQSTKWATLLNI